MKKSDLHVASCGPTSFRPRSPCERGREGGYFYERSAFAGLESAFCGAADAPALSTEAGGSGLVRKNLRFQESVDPLQNSPMRAGIPCFHSETPLQNVHNSI